MLGNLRISFKLMIMVALAMLGIVAVAAVGLSALKDNLIEDRKAKLKNVVEMAVQALDRDREAAKLAGLSDADMLARSKALLGSLRFDGDDYFYAIGPDGTIQVHISPKLVGQNNIDKPDADGVFYTRDEVELIRRGASDFIAFRFPRPGGKEPLPKLVYLASYQPYHWGIAGGIYLDDVDAIFWSQVEKIGALVGICLLLVLGMSVFMGRSIVGPINGMTKAMRKLAGGDIDAEIPARDRRDEVGAMAQSVQVFKENMAEAALLRREQDGLKQQSEVEKKSLMGKLADEFERAISLSLDTLGNSAAGLRTMSESMSAVANTASQRSATVATAAEQATANVQTVAAATEELSSSVTEIGRQVTQSSAIAGQAVNEADRTNVTVQGLSSAAMKIGDVVQLISDIASQTNLLALNATIEAARAGDAGRGFAVVANEVKSLASQTAKATEEISTHVAAMQGATNEAVQAIEKIGGTISSIHGISTTIAAAVEEQGAATREIARNVQQAAQGNGQVSHNITGVNQAAAEAGLAADQVLQSADELSRQSAKLRTDVDQFLQRIRAA
jgi:methyl-accepting chemotaxis protein